MRSHILKLVVGHSDPLKQPHRYLTVTPDYIKCGFTDKSRRLGIAING
jgi:hypothetical protein